MNTKLYSTYYRRLSLLATKIIARAEEGCRIEDAKKEALKLRELLEDIEVEFEFNGISYLTGPDNEVLPIAALLTLSPEKVN